MSGGHFDFVQHRLADAAIKLRRLLRTKQVDLEWPQDPIPKEILLKFAHLADVLSAASAGLNAADYYLCGDAGDESFAAEWKKNVEPKLKRIYRHGKVQDNRSP
jgi:hypothetical protein